MKFEFPQFKKKEKPLFVSIDSSIDTTPTLSDLNKKKEKVEQYKAYVEEGRKKIKSIAK